MTDSQEAVWLKPSEQLGTGGREKSGRNGEASLEGRNGQREGSSLQALKTD